MELTYTSNENPISVPAKSTGVYATLTKPRRQLQNLYGEGAPQTVWNHIIISQVENIFQKWEYLKLNIEKFDSQNHHNNTFVHIM